MAQGVRVPVGLKVCSWAQGGTGSEGTCRTEGVLVVSAKLECTR